MKRARPLQPRGPAGRPAERAVRAPADARPDTRRCRGSRSPSRWSRAGSTRWSARPTAERMPAASRLQEAFRRRRAAGGPAEETFASLVGLELRPRRLREASALWGSLRTRQGAEARDGVWMHPDLLPSADDLDDPLGLPRGSLGSRRAECRRLRRRAAEPPRGRARPGRAHRVTLHADALALLRAWTAPTPTQAALQQRYVDHLAAHPDGMRRGCYPDHLTASTLVVSADGGAGAADPARQGPAVVPARRPLRARRPDPGRGGAARGHRGVRDRPGCGLDPVPVQLSEHPVPFCGPRGDVHHLDVRFVAVAPAGAEHRRQRGVAGAALVPGGRRAQLRADRAGRPGAGGARLEQGLVVLDRAAARGGRRRTSRAGSPWRARPAGSGPPRPRTPASCPCSSRCASSCTRT